MAAPHGAGSGPSPPADRSGGRPVRRSQTERRASSRALILEAALHQLVEHGYTGTTTVTIQERAGVSRGRLLHHFRSRDAVLIAAAQYLVVEQLAEMERWVLGSDYGGSGGAERVDRAVELLWNTFQQPYFWAAMELWVVARTSEDLRTALLPEEQRLGTAVWHVVATLFGPLHSSHPEFDALRELLFTSMRGTAMAYAIAPRDPADDPHLPMWKALARRMLDASDAG